MPAVTTADQDISHSLLQASEPYLSLQGSPCDGMEFLCVARPESSRARMAHVQGECFSMWHRPDHTQFCMAIKAHAMLDSIHWHIMNALTP